MARTVPIDPPDPYRVLLKHTPMRPYWWPARKHWHRHERDALTAAEMFRDLGYEAIVVRHSTVDATLALLNG